LQQSSVYSNKVYFIRV